LTNLTPDTKEKTSPAGLAHLSILIPGIGFVVPLLLWFWQRKASAYVRFQILQAFVFQMLQVVFWQVILLLLSLVLIMVQVINAALHPHWFIQRAVLLQVLTATAAIFVGVNLVYIGIAVWGGVMVLSGKAWAYPWLGKKIEHGLVAAMNHFALFYGLNGLLVPFLTWIVKRDASRYLTYHTLQALGLQVFSTILYHLLVVVQAVLAIPLMMVVWSMINQTATLIYSKTLIMASLIASGFTMLITFLVIPLLAVFATVAAIRLLKNKPYDYPIIGKMIKNQMNRTPFTAVKTA
jgi:uncharacterized Tic20 family protein